MKRQESIKRNEVWEEWLEYTSELPFSLGETEEDWKQWFDTWLAGYKAGYRTAVSDHV